MPFSTPSGLLMLTLQGETNRRHVRLILNHSLLIIPLKMRSVPHSRYRGPIKFV